MGKVKNLSWTPKQVEIKELLLQGLSPQEIIAKGYSHTMVSRVKLELEKGGIKVGKQVGREVGKEVKQVSQPDPRLSTQGHSSIRPRLLESVGVGEILIEPADWRVNQFGGFLIMSTYMNAKQLFGYTGSVGDFLCDACQVMRRVMGLDLVSTEYLIHKKEEDDGRRIEGDNGAGVLSEVGDEGSSPGTTEQA